MEIKNIGGLSPVNDTKKKNDKREDIHVSFQEYMQKRLHPESAAPAANGGVSVENLYGMTEIEAVATRSRIIQGTGGDVSDFLELVKEKPYLQREYARLMELAEQGVLTKDDVQKTRLSVSPDEDDLMGYLAREPGFRDVLSIDEADYKARLEAMIRNERFTYNHVSARYGKRAASVSELADSHQRVLDTLNNI